MGINSHIDWENLPETPPDDPIFSGMPSFVFRNAQPESTPDTSEETPEEPQEA